MSGNAVFVLFVFSVTIFSKVINFQMTFSLRIKEFQNL